VLDELDKRKLADNTLVLFQGDNGAAQWRGKGTLHEYGIKVPLLVRWPGVSKPGTDSAALISGEDLAPTLLEACGEKPLKEMTGKSFLPLLKGEKFDGRKFVFAERGAHGQGLPGNSSAFDLGRVVVGKTHKLIYNATFHLPYHAVDFGGSEMFKEVRELAKAKKLPEPLNALYDGRARDMIEVYDLTNDPNEFVNLAGKPEAAAAEKELRAALLEWMILERDFLPLPVANPGAKKK
jgi:N-sulfoglucosamine sulfohydrolase